MRVRWCTARWRAGAGSGRPPAPVRLAVVTAVLATTCVLPGGLALAAGTPSGYAFDEDARRVEGASTTADAPLLEAGTSYRSSLPRNGTLHYRLELDAASDTYVSATAVPGEGDELTAVDGIRLSVRDAGGATCSLDSATFGAAHSPRPVTAQAVRAVSPGTTRCQDAGTYDVTVERARPKDSPPDPWDLELTAVTEPRPERTGATQAPEAWNSASPAPLTGEPARLRGGSGFAEATAAGPGAWRDDIRPGQTLYYKVPVDWGRQPYAAAELGGTDSGSGYATSALRLALHNPVRGEVVDAAKGYTGRRVTAALAPVPPVAYANRYAHDDRVSGMRFAGEYYLVVHLAARVAEDFGEGPFPLVLRLRLEGTAQAGPGYAGGSVPGGVFEVPAHDRTTAPADGTDREDGAAMTVLAVGGIGTGSVLLAGLGVWTAVARRRAV
ncbi:hypothetical protein AB0E77_22840 [Streptomyces sp. NPDC032940]|uniref:hypothetical protein n=1 Tax=Streptomyces sp. NPDC032940 TaxID=3155366 RepID=UPI0033EE332D